MITLPRAARSDSLKNLTSPAVVMRHTLRLRRRAQELAETHCLAGVVETRTVEFVRTEIRLSFALENFAGFSPFITSRESREGKRECKAVMHCGCHLLLHDFLAMQQSSARLLKGFPRLYSITRALSRARSCWARTCRQANAQ